mgnify:CR=1 FL=1
MTIKEAQEITGGLSDPSKMPGKSYSLPSERCITGSILRRIEGSVCSNCYACKGTYRFGNVRNALDRRYRSLDHPQWAEAMETLIKNEPCSYFRWHDSGDIQSYEHFLNITEVCERCPGYYFQIPTREYHIIFKYIEEYPVPDNLVIRLSSFMIDGRSLPDTGDLPVARSLVYNDPEEAPEGYVCPATTVRHKCENCRACWSKDAECIIFREH